MAQVKTYTGTAASQRARAIHRHLLEAPARTRLIVPTQRAVQQRMRQLLAESPDAGGFLGRPIMTFQDFASSLLEGSDDHFPLVSPTTQQLLLKRSIELAHDVGLLTFLGDAAERPGLVHHVQRVIAQLKQDAISPMDFRDMIARRKHPSPFDDTIAEIYTNYQNLLLGSKTFDLQGMYWLADLACQRNPPAGIVDIDTVLIDGFDDFTPSEFRLIQSVEAHVDTLVFGLNYDPAPQRSDAYALVRSTHVHIQESFSTQSEDFDEAKAEAQTCSEQLARTLFGRDSSDLDSLSPNAYADVSLRACHTVTHEIESMARSIKHRILSEGVHPSEILVVMKQPEIFSHTLIQIFDEAGIPVQPVQNTTLAQSSTADFFLRVYESTAQWEREAIVHVLCSPVFQSWAQSPPEHVALYRHLAYRAEILEGMYQWGSRLNHLAERLLKHNEREVDAWLQHMPHLQEACASLIRDVERLKDWSDGIPASATLHDHMQALAILRSPFSEEAMLGIEREFHAWNALKALSMDVAKTADVMHALMPRADFVGQLRELYALVPLPEASDAQGVLCLRVDDARHIQQPYVYVCGVNEGTIPAPPPVNAIYAQADQQDLAAVGLRMPSHREHAEKERLQFLRLFSIATKHLTISWHECTQQGQVLYPSPFVQDVRDVYAHTGNPVSLLVHTPDPVWPVMNVREAMNASVTEKKALSPALESSVEQALGKLRVERSRYASSPFNAYDGVLSVPEIVGTVADYYNTQHLFSANQIETYIDCPFRFMLRTLLKLPERETPALSFDRKVMGNIYHNALENFYRQYAGLLLEQLNLDEVRTEMTRIANMVFDETVGGFQEAYPGIARVERARIVQKLIAHVENHHQEGSQGWKPSYLEATFGETPREGGETISKQDPFRFDVDGESYLFTGRIDRVDLNDEGDARIVDYKSSLGSIDEKDITEGRNIQLSLYAMALEEVMMPGTVCSETVYLKVGHDETKGNPKRAQGNPREAAQAAIRETIQAIQAGVFHPKAHKESCTYCPSNKVCRFEEGRIAGKSPR